jgi:hypothetical protein
MRSICVHRAHSGHFYGAFRREDRAECGVVLHAVQTVRRGGHATLRRVAFRER